MGITLQRFHFLNKDVHFGFFNILLFVKRLRKENHTPKDTQITNMEKRKYVTYFSLQKEEGSELTLLREQDLRFLE